MSARASVGTMTRLGLAPTLAWASSYTLPAILPAATRAAPAVVAHEATAAPAPPPRDFRHAEPLLVCVVTIVGAPA